MNEKIEYVGKDLEAMSFAVNYHKWILDEFRTHLGKNVVEVGSGTGSFSEMLLDENPEVLTLIEPSEMFNYLEENISRIKTDTKICFYQSVFTECSDKLNGNSKPDSVIYVNVLEHVEDDMTELKTIYQTLKSGGKCFVFVPALMMLYGEFDRKIGHFRRYTKKEIEEKFQAAGFRIVKSKYFDFLGMFPWYIKYKLLKSDSLDSNSVALYDKLAVPITKLAEKIITPFVGKSVLIIGEK